MKFNLVLIALLGAHAIQAPSNPDNARKVFEESVAKASKTVATQQAFEKSKVADVAARNAKDTAEANALKLKVRKAANNNLMGRTSPDNSKQQWTGPELV